MTPAVDTEALGATLAECLFKDAELTAQERDTRNILQPHKLGKGILRDFAFHPERLENNRAKVEAWLRLMPDSFFKSRGGGWSFLNMCMDRYDRHWGEHVNMEQLVALGNALGVVNFTLPRDMWTSMPGGMPYLTITIDP